MDLTVHIVFVNVYKDAMARDCQFFGQFKAFLFVLEGFICNFFRLEQNFKVKRILEIAAKDFKSFWDPIANTSRERGTRIVSI